MMSLIAVVWAMVLAAWAQSPHVYRPVLPAGWEEQPQATVFNASSPPFVAKPRVGDPTPRMQEDRPPPMFPNPDCFFCPDPPKNKDAAEFLLNSFTTERFLRLAKDRFGYATTLRDRCVFYTRNISHPSALSRGATEIACGHDKLTIWQLWPNAKNAYDTRNRNPPMINYYGLYTEGEPLFFISKLPSLPGPKKSAIQYFENMSRAMARMCSGQVYLVTDIPFPFDLKAFQFGGRYWPNIWASTEYPELRNRIAAGMVDGGALIVIEFATVAFPKPRAWKIDWEALVPLSDTETAWKRDKYPIIPAELWEPYDLASELPARSGLYSQMESGGRCDMTDTGLDSEPAGMDFFG